uniref:Secreted protein n=1 Tax=Strongyloides papillosus TaxID=174720 RepID=A0A0N5C7M4_STREA
MLQLAIVAFLVFEIQRLYSLPIADCNSNSSTLSVKSAKPPPWRNRLARSAVNRKVGGSSPPGGVGNFLVHRPGSSGCKQ